MKTVYKVLVVVAIVLVVFAAVRALVSASLLTGDGYNGRQPISKYHQLIHGDDVPDLRPDPGSAPAEQ